MKSKPPRAIRLDNPQACIRESLRLSDLRFGQNIFILGWASYTHNIVIHWTKIAEGKNGKRKCRPLDGGYS